MGPHSDIQRQDADTQNKKLDLVHLNALVSKNAKCNIYVNNDTINIKETGSKKTDATPKDVVYSLNNVEPRNYTLLVNGKKVELDLRDINAKWNYSLLENGSVRIIGCHNPRRIENRIISTGTTNGF
jgi:hypothetical protein